MAKETTPVEEEWEEVKIGLGEEWDFEKNGDLIGTLVGAKNIDLPEHSWGTGPDGEVRKTAGVWEIANDNGEIFFIWDSYQLTEALTDFGRGDRIKVHFDGYRKFDSKGGPRQVKQYRVFGPKK